ncbi:MAG: AAA family ATPase [Deltaproteobacteria bacterium]|jgi:predicted ATP-binding protein involved in virulence|nr:AAA family ATPase [Deltaproteobacteria bacterium]
MKLESLGLKNFRCFTDITVDFDPQLTVFVGVNGAGKTALLDAIAVFLEPLMKKQYSLENSYPFIQIDNSDISLLTKKEPTFSIKFSEIKKLGDSFVTQSNGSGILDIGSRIEYIKHIYPAILEQRPYYGKHIFAYYGAQRCLPKNYATNRPLKGIDALREGAFSAQVDFNTSLVWFNDKDAEEARQNRNKNDLTYRDPHLSAVRDAITKSLGGDMYEFPHMDGVPPELYINNKQNGLPYKVTQLSDGYKTMLALVMDLARRMAMANAEQFGPRKSVLESPGIVLIDEVDLHLHPSWQQTVLPSLMNIFPNTQFIVTTHSPQVLTSIPAKHIRVLEEGKVHTESEETEGAESSRLLKRIFEVEPRPQENELTQKLHEYEQLVYDEQWDTSRAHELQKELIDRYGDAEPLLKKLDLHIENSKWERRA